MYIFNPRNYDSGGMLDSDFMGEDMEMPLGSDDDSNDDISHIVDTGRETYSYQISWNCMLFLIINKVYKQSSRIISARAYIKVTPNSMTLHAIPISTLFIPRLLLTLVLPLF